MPRLLLKYRSISHAQHKEIMKIVRRALCVFAAVIATAVAGSSQTPDSFLNQGNDKLRQKKYEDANISYTECLKLAPRDTRCLFNRGLVRSIAIGYGLAVEDFTSVIAIDPTHVKAWNQRGETYLSMQQAEKALADLNKAIELKANYADAYYNRARVFAKKKDNDAAIADYSKAVQFDPKMDIAWAFRALLYKDKGDLDKALSDLTKAVELSPNDAYYLYNRGEVLFKQDKTDLAEADFNRALAIDPKYGTQVRSLKTLANVDKMLSKNKQPATTPKPASTPAATPAVPAPTSTTTKPGDYQKAGTDRMIVGDTDGAIAQYSGCIRQFGNAGTYDCYVSRAFAYKQKGSTELAFADLAKAIEIDGVSARAYLQRAELYYSMNEYAKSIPDYSAAIKADPKQMTPLFFRGIAYQKLDKHSLALLDFTEAIRLYPNANYIAFRGISHMALKNSDEAFADFAAAIAKDPKNYTAFHHRGTLHLAKGDREKAIADFRAAIAAKPDFQSPRLELEKLGVTP